MAEDLFLEKVESISGGALPEIREFIIRKLGCEHWEDKISRNQPRDLAFRRAVKHLRCDTLEADEDFLRKTYAQHRASMSALDAMQGIQASSADAVVPPHPPSPPVGF